MKSIPLILLLLGCASGELLCDDDAPCVCTPGTRQACEFEGCFGWQTCDGSWSSCEIVTCETPGDGGIDVMDAGVPQHVRADVRSDAEADVSYDVASDGRTGPDGSSSGSGPDMSAIPERHYPIEQAYDVIGSSPSVPSIGYLASTSFPGLDTEVTRISDYDRFRGWMTGLGSDSVDNSNLQHAYSRTQAWNADKGRILFNGGWRWRALLDGENYTFIKELQHCPLDARWSRAEPDVIYGISTDDQRRLVSFSPERDEQTELFTFSDYDEVRMGSGEGDLTEDGTRVLISARAGSDLILIVFDLIGREVLASRRHPGAWGSLNWAGLSRSGEYAVRFGGVSGERLAHEIYRASDMSTLRVILAPGHSDMAVDDEGHDVIVFAGNHKACLISTI